MDLNKFIFFCLKLVFNWLENKKLTRIQNNPKPQSIFFFYKIKEKKDLNGILHQMKLVDNKNDEFHH
jgi:hypothetical protein